MAKYWELLFNFNLTNFISRSKRGLQIICLRSFTSTCPREAPVQCLTVYPQYATLTLDTRICALYCRLPVFPSIQITHAVSKLRTHVMAKIVPMVQLAVHAKSSTFYGRSYGRRSKFFSVWWVTTTIFISVNYVWQTSLSPTDVLYSIR